MIKWLVLCGTIGAAWASSVNDITGVHIRLSVLGMHSTNFGSDYVKEVTLGALVKQGSFGHVPLGNTTIVVTASNSTSHDIYQGELNLMVDSTVTAVTVMMLDLYPDAVPNQDNVCPFYTSIQIKPSRLIIGEPTEIHYDALDIDGDALNHSITTAFDASTTVAACPGQDDCISVTAGAGETLGAKTVDIEVTDGTCAVEESFDTVIAQAVQSLDLSVHWQSTVRSLSSDGTAVREAGDTITVTVGLEDIYVSPDNEGTVTVIDTCDLSGSTTTANTYDSTTVTITHDFKGNAAGEKCTATYTFVNHHNIATDPVTFVYYSGGADAAFSYAPVVDFAFVSDTNLQNGDLMTLVVHTSSQDDAAISGSWSDASAFATANAPVLATNGHFMITYNITDASSIHTVNFTATAYNLDTVRSFYLNTASPTYTTASPTAVCSFPDACAAGSIGDASTSKYLYVHGSTEVDHIRLPPGSVIAIQATDPAIFDPSITLDIDHAVANCGEIEARVASVTLNNDGGVYYMELDDMYYNGQWHNGTNLIADASQLPIPVSFRILQAPMVPSGQLVQVQDCDNNNAVLITHIIMDHYESPESEPCTVHPEDGHLAYVVVNETNECHVGLLTWDDTTCDALEPVRLPCDGTCTPYHNHYVAAAASGDVNIYEDTDTMCALPPLDTLPPTGNLHMRQATGSFSDKTHYASQLFSAPDPCTTLEAHYSSEVLAGTVAQCPAQVAGECHVYQSLNNGVNAGRTCSSFCSAASMTCVNGWGDAAGNTCQTDLAVDVIGCDDMDDMSGDHMCACA